MKPIAPNDSLPFERNLSSWILQNGRSLNQAFQLRLGRSSAKKEDRIAEFQGAITGLLCASDTILKTSLGFWRRLLYPRQDEFVQSRQTVTGVIEPTLRQRPYSRPINSKPLLMAIVRVDSKHMFKPMGLSRIIHEVAHLFYDSEVDQEVRNFIATSMPNPNDKSQYRKATESAYLAASEVFCDVAVGLFAYWPNHEAFARYQLSIAQNLQCELKTKSTDSYIDLCSKLTQIQYRAFVVNEILQSLNARGKVQDIRFELAWFRKFIASNHLGEPSLPGYGTPRESYDVLIENLAAIYRAIIPSLVPFIEQAHRLVCEKRAASISASSFEDKVQSAIASGVPVGFERPEDQKVDEGIAIRSLLKHYVLHSKPEANSIQDRLEEYRLSSLVMKSLWHISTRQRRRRMGELLKNVSSLKD